MEQADTKIEQISFDDFMEQPGWYIAIASGIRGPEIQTDFRISGDDGTALLTPSSRNVADRAVAIPEDLKRCRGHVPGTNKVLTRGFITATNGTPVLFRIKGQIPMDALLIPA